MDGQVDSADGDMTPAFGAQLRRWRTAAGLSLGELAARTHYSKGHLSKVESGLKRPSEQLGRQCDVAVGANGALLALVSTPTGPGPTAAPSTVPTPRAAMPRTAGDAAGSVGWAPETWVLELAPDGHGRFAEGAVRSLTGVPDGLGVVTFAGRYTTAAPDIEGLTALAESLRALGRTTSPAAVLPLAISHLHAVRVLAGGAHEADRRRLYFLASRLAEFTGWMAQEAGDGRAALWWTDQAVAFAQAAGDTALGDYARVRRGLVSLYRGDAGETVALVGPLRGRSGLPPRVRWLAALREAQGHSLAGEASQALRCLDAARELSTRLPDDEPGPQLGPTSVPDQTTLVHGWCLVDLGRVREASDLLGAELARLTAKQARARARFGVRLAMARASDGDIESACADLDGIAAELRRADSATIRADLRGFVALARRWQHHPDAHRLRARLRPASVTP